MSKRASPTLVGGFVLGGLALIVAGVIFFGGANLFSQTQRFVIYFDGSVNGLQIGSPVKFAGVEIGSVRQISVIGDVTEGFDAYTETIVEIDRSRFEQRGEFPVDEGKRMGMLAEQGLRARLQLQSLITGQLYVALAILPEYPIREFPHEAPYPEIPAVPTVGQEIEATARGLLHRIQELPIETLAARIDSAITGLDELVNDPTLRANLNGALVQTRRTMNEAQVTFTNLGPGSPMNYQLSTALRELADAARAIRVLADYVEQNPNSLVFGRPAGSE